MKGRLNNRGINMLELIVVIALIAVLAGFLFPTISKARMHVKVAETKMTMAQISMAVEMYHADYKKYPDTLQQLDAIGISIDELPKDPFNPNDDHFQYYVNQYPYKGSTYIPGQLWGISSFGPDKNDDVTPARDTVASELTGMGISLDAEGFYDACAYNFYASGGGKSDWPLDATSQSGYNNGDLLLFGPVQLKSLAEVDYGFGFWPWSVFGF